MIGVLQDSLPPLGGNLPINLAAMTILVGLATWIIRMAVIRYETDSQNYRALLVKTIDELRGDVRTLTDVTTRLERMLLIQGYRDPKDPQGDAAARTPLKA